MLLTRKQLLNKQPLKKEKVEILDGFVFVRQMTGRERDRFEQSLMITVTKPDGTVTMERNLEDFRAKLAVQTVCDENGVNILNQDDYELLSQNISAATLEEITETAQRLNAITKKDRDNLVKNSSDAQKDSSISDSVSS